MLFVIGETRAELGGWHYLRVENLESGNDIPPVDGAANLATLRTVQKAIKAGLIRSAHDLSEGGLTVAAAEMGFSGGLGIDISLENLPTAGDSVSDIAKLFGESAGRFLVEVTPENSAAFEEMMAELKIPCGQIGKITDSQRLVIDGFIDAGNEDCKSAWNTTFDW